eukprot:9497196-Pyramimonas_sp.AAC.1
MAACKTTGTHQQHQRKTTANNGKPHQANPRQNYSKLMETRSEPQQTIASHSKVIAKTQHNHRKTTANHSPRGPSGTKGPDWQPPKVTDPTSGFHP